MSFLKILFEVTKLRITVLVAFTTTLGYILALNDINGFSLYPIAGIFLLACGAAAMNHYQERRTDKLMDRTKHRPIPSGAASPNFVLTISIALLLAGVIILLFKSNFITLGIGLLTFVWYNGVYTPLKKIFSMAIIPGSLVGSLPPVAGWTAAGGDIFDPKILLIASFFFIWQIPHFWILLLAYGNDYSKGGFPTLTNIMTKRQLMNVTFSWLVLTIAIAITFNFFGILNYIPSNVILLFICLWILKETFKFVRSDGNNKAVKKMFITINIFTLLIITLLSIDKLIKLFLE